jgi:HAMP domain-containing protein
MPSLLDQRLMAIDRAGRYRHRRRECGSRRRSRARFGVVVIAIPANSIGGRQRRLVNARRSISTDVRGHCGHAAWRLVDRALIPIASATASLSTMSFTRTGPLPGLAGRSDGSTWCGRHDDSTRASEWHASRHDVFGYPASWPAGPWIVLLFWLAVAVGAWLLQSLS